MIVNGEGGGGDITISQISDRGATGADLLATATAAAARGVIGLPRTSYTLADFTGAAASGAVDTEVISGTTYYRLGVTSDPIRYDQSTVTAPRYTLAIPAGSRRVRARFRVKSVSVGAADGYDVIVCGWYADTANPGTWGYGLYQILTYSARAGAIGGPWGTYPGTDLLVGGLGGSVASTTWLQLDLDLAQRTMLWSLGTGSGDTPPTAWTLYASSRLDVAAATGAPDLDTPGSLVLWLGRPDSASAGAALTLAMDCRVEIDT